MRRVYILVSTLVLAAVLFYLFFMVKSESTKAVYTTSAVRKGDISVIVTATGTVEAVTTVEVGSQVSGTISALYADFNDLVKKGQVLAQLDPTFLKAQVSQAQADLEKAEASAKLSKTEYDRSLSLFEKNLISESDRDVAATNYELAKAEEKSAKANLDRVITNLDYSTIASPIDGVVISRNVDVGQTVAASLQAPTLFTIAQDLSKMEVQTSVDEADIGSIRPDQEAVFTVDAYPEKSFRGIVKQIRLAPEIVQNVVSYDVIIGVSNPDLLLKPGMTANVTIQIEHNENVLQVPSAALRFHPTIQAGQSSTTGRSSYAGDTNRQKPDSSSSEKTTWGTVWVLNQQGQPESIRVQVGISNGTFTEIISDRLKKGDLVVTGQEGAASSSTSSSQQVNPFAPNFRGGRR